MATSPTAPKRRTRNTPADAPGAPTATAGATPAPAAPEAKAAADTGAPAKAAPAPAAGQPPEAVTKSAAKTATKSAAKPAKTAKPSGQPALGKAGKAAKPAAGAAAAPTTPTAPAAPAGPAAPDAADGAAAPAASAAAAKPARSGGKTTATPAGKSAGKKTAAHSDKPAKAGKAAAEAAATAATAAAAAAEPAPAARPTPAKKAPAKKAKAPAPVQAAPLASSAPHSAAAPTDADRTTPPAPPPATDAGSPPGRAKPTRPAAAGAGKKASTQGTRAAAKANKPATRPTAPAAAAPTSAPADAPAAQGQTGDVLAAVAANENAAPTPSDTVQTADDTGTGSGTSADPGTHSAETGDAPAEAHTPALTDTAAPAEPTDASHRPTRGQRADRAPRQDRAQREDRSPPARGAPGTRAPQHAPAAQAAEAAPATLLLPAPDALPHSQLQLLDDGALRRLRWVPGLGQPLNLAEALAPHLDDAGHLAPDDDAVVPLLLRLAAEARHPVQVAPAVWPFLAAHRDARTRCAVLAQAHPAGPASPALQQLLAVGLPPFQAEGALWAVTAGRALLADAPGLGKGVQALAAAQLWRRHFGLRRVLVLCAPAEALAWQRAWQRLAGLPAQVMTGALQHRQALWQTEAEVRVITPDALASDAGHLQAWAPDLVLVDEPQRLGLDAQAWALLDAPHALVLCGAALETQPELLDTLVDWLDPARLGPLAALREVRAARDGTAELDDAALERVSAQLSRVLLQRQPEEVRAQLPAIAYSSRLVTLSDGQRQAHDQARQVAQRLLAAWQASGVLSDADQWRLSQAVVAMQQAGRRAPASDATGLPQPAQADQPPPLAEAMVQALSTLLAQDPAGDAPQAPEPAPAAQDPRDDTPEAAGADAAATSVTAVSWAVLCEHPADCAQLAQRLGPRPGVHLVAPGQALPPGPLRVVQVGAPWRLRQRPLTRGDATGSSAGQRWFSLVAADSLDLGLVDTLGARADTPVGPAEAGSRGFLAGSARQAWLQAVAAALRAIEA